MPPTPGTLWRGITTDRLVCIRSSTNDHVSYEWTQDGKVRVRTTWVDSFLKHYEPKQQINLDEIIRELRASVRAGHQLLLAPDQIRTLLRHFDQPGPAPFTIQPEHPECTDRCGHSSFNPHCWSDV